MKTIDADVFMAVLAKALTAKAVRSNDGRENLRKIDKFLREDLPDALNHTGHPNAPGLSAACETLLKSLDTASLYRNILATPLVMLEGKSAKQMFQFLKGFIFDELSVLKWFDCEWRIPILVTNGKSTKLEVINFANSRLVLDVVEKEFSVLSEGCRQNQIDLAKIVKCIVITTPLKKTSCSFLLQHTGTEKDNVFARYVAKRFFVTEAENLPEENQKYDGVLCAHTVKNCKGTVPVYTPSGFVKLLAGELTIPLFGFLEEYNWIVVNALSYYYDTMSQSESLADSLTDDLVRMESGAKSSSGTSGKKKEKIVVVSKQSPSKEKPKTAKSAQATKVVRQTFLDSLREQKRVEAENGKTNLKKVKLLLTHGKELLIDIVGTLEADITSVRTTPRAVLDDIFKAFFKAASVKDIAMCRELVTHLQTLEYDGLKLTKQYLQKIGKDNEKSLTSKELENQCSSLQVNEWEKWKILIELVEIEELSQATLKKMMSPLADYISSGKECYANAMLMKGPEAETYLWSSLQKGYYPAAHRLMDMVVDDKETLNLLAQYLVPEACLAVGDIEMASAKDGKRANSKGVPEYITIQNPKLLYYKLAASQGVNEALARICDSIFSSFFNKVNFIEKQPVELQALFVENAKVVCWAANKLVGDSYQTQHFKEVLGITLFCFNDKRKFSEVRKLLSSIRKRSSEASYCLGYMSEFGLGCAQNFSSAIKYYKKATENGALRANGEYVSKRLNAATNKARAQFEERMGGYNDDDDYEEESTTESYPSGGGGLTMVFLVSLGLSYYARQLEEIRNFRDAHLSNTPLGLQMVEEYYRTAPAIRQGIATIGNTQAFCDQLWGSHVQQIQKAIQDGDWQEAKQKVIEMQVNLCNQFEISYNQELVAKYKQQENLS
ncbi:MAG: SEL1-like repeat protein [Kiritimatiellae bacterium]|nr:SEL1-like repeat protein [Kiritimatiellia bacterium]